jgi:hypothetical protein
MNGIRKRGMFTQNINATVTPQMKEAFRSLAKAEDTSVSELARVAIEFFLANYDRISTDKVNNSTEGGDAGE